MGQAFKKLNLNTHYELVIIDTRTKYRRNLNDFTELVKASLLARYTDEAGKYFILKAMVFLRSLKDVTYTDLVNLVNTFKTRRNMN